jgi:hypothetical protein
MVSVMSQAFAHVMYSLNKNLEKNFHAHNILLAKILETLNKKKKKKKKKKKNETQKKEKEGSKPGGICSD